MTVNIKKEMPATNANNLVEHVNLGNIVNPAILGCFTAQNPGEPVLHKLLALYFCYLY